MIWPFNSSNKEPHVLLNNLNSDDVNVHKSAYKELLNTTDSSVEQLMISALENSDTPKNTKLSLISILGHRGVTEAISVLKECIDFTDFDIRVASVNSLYEIGTPECIDELVLLLADKDDRIKQKSEELISKLPEKDAMGALIRAIPEDVNSELYFSIVSVMEDLDFFSIIKENFSQPDPMVKKFYFNTIVKFNRTDFIPLYLSYYPVAPTEIKNQIIDILKDYNTKESLPYYIDYIKEKGSDGLANVIDSVILPKYNENPNEILKLITVIPDVRYRLKTLPIVFKKLDPYCYDIIFELLKDNSPDIRDIASNALISLISKTWKRINSFNEPNKEHLREMYNKWEFNISSYMRDRDELNADFYKQIRKVFFEFSRNNHEILLPFVSELVNRDFFETYYSLKDWSFDSKYEVYKDIAKNDPSFGFIMLSSLNARADENLWRIGIKLANAFEENDDSKVYIKGLLSRHPNMSFERYVKDDDPGVRAAALKFICEMRMAGYVEQLKLAVKDHSSEVRKSALDCLIENNFNSSQQLIFDALNDPDESIVLYILKVLHVKLGAQKISPYLVRFVNSSNPELREFAKSEIATVTKERYKNNFNSMTPEMRKLAAQAIQKIDNSFVDDVINDLSSFDPQARLKAALLLENIQAGDKAKDALIAAMRDPSKRVRAAIVKTLGVIGSKDLVKQLIEFFNDTDPRVRANTVESIASLGDSQVVQILLPYLEDSNNRIRANAVVGIRKFGNFNVTTVLQQMLMDSDDNMKASALWAIGEIGDPAYLPLTYGFMTNKNDLIRYNSIKAISRINPNLLTQYMPMLRKDTSAKIKQLVKDLSYKLI